MNREQEILTRAMSYVDDDMIIAAHAPHKKLRHRIPALAAACLAVAIIAAFPYVRSVADGHIKNEGAAPLPGDAGFMSPDETERPPFHFGNQEDPSPEPDPFRVCTFGGTTIQLTNWTETTVTFTLKKADSTPVYVAFLQNSGAALGCSEPDFRDNGTVIRPYVVRVYVNGGELQYTLPEKPGEYEVLIDYSSIRRMPYVMKEGVMLYAYVGEKGAPVDEWLPFDASHKTDTETVAGSGAEAGTDAVSGSAGDTEEVA